MTDKLLLNWVARYSPVIDFVQSRCPRGCAILEVGCGPYGLAAFLSQRVVGLDASFADGHHKMVLPVRGEVTALPFGSRAFELVVSLDLIEHLEPADRPLAIAEMYRVAGRYLIVGCPVGQVARRCDLRFAEWMGSHGRPLPDWLKEHLRIPTPEEREVLDCMARLPGADCQVIPNENWAFHFMAVVADHLPEVVERLGPEIARNQQEWVEMCRGINFGECYRKLFIATRR